MSEMVERVARAIVARRQYMWADKSGTIFVEPLELAHAAIEAMREPTEDMSQCGAMTPDGFQPYPETCAVTWRAMIAAALKAPVT